MSAVVQFRKRGRPYSQPSADDLLLEVEALRAEQRDLVAAAMPLVNQLAVYGQNASPAVLARANALGHLLERVNRRTQPGAA